jgi:hypothetical protein
MAATCIIQLYSGGSSTKRIDRPLGERATTAARVRSIREDRRVVPPLAEISHDRIGDGRDVPATLASYRLIMSASVAPTTARPSTSAAIHGTSTAVSTRT